MWRQLSSITRLLQPAAFTQSTSILKNHCLRSFSVLTANNATPKANNQLTKSLLQPPSLTINPERGMKQMGVLKRRCKDCYFVMREERLFVMCKTHPRHKQMAMKKKPKNTWILTDATQSKQRAW